MASSKAASAHERGGGWTRAVTALPVLAALMFVLLVLPSPAAAKPLVALEEDVGGPAGNASMSLSRDATQLFFDDMESGTNGWTSIDYSVTPLPAQFHIDTYYAYDDPLFETDHSWWCGNFLYDGDGGYGNYWNHVLDLPEVTLSGSTEIQFQYRCDSEDGYDVTYLEAEQGGRYQIIEVFHGNSSGWQLSPSFSLAGYDSPAHIRFRFESDETVSDEDAWWDSDGGAFMCDNIHIYDSATRTTLFYDDCETDGLCTPSVPPKPGSLWHIIDRACSAESTPHSWWSGADADTTHIPSGVHDLLVSPSIGVGALPAGAPCKVKLRLTAQVPLVTFSPPPPYIPPFDYYDYLLSLDGGGSWIDLTTTTTGTNIVYVGDYVCSSHRTAYFWLTPYLPATSFNFGVLFHTTGDGCGPGAYGGAGITVDDVQVLAWPPPAGGPNVVCEPDPLSLNLTTTSGRVAVDYWGGGSDLLYGYSVKFSWDPAKVSTSLTNVLQGTLLSSGSVTTRFLRYQSGPNEITVDCARLGDRPGVAGPGTMFTIDFSAVASGESPVDLTILAVRDRYNNPLTGFSEDDGLIKVDIVKPVITAVHISNETLAHTDEYVKNGDSVKLTATVADDDPAFGVSNITAGLTGLARGAAVSPDSYNPLTDEAVWNAWTVGTCSPQDGTITVTVNATDPLGNAADPASDTILADNTRPDPIQAFAVAPAHEELVMSWGDPTGLDDHYYGVMGRYYVWGQYPEYDPPAPSYPANPAQGVLAFDQTGPVMAWNLDVVPRDIYYVSAWVYDYALNYSEVGGKGAGQDRATNYWLGDVANTGDSWVPDGLVTVNDINKLAGQYGSAPTGDFNTCDVGPTDDHGRLGIPQPDDFLSFEDLMIFAMNYGVVAPRIVPFLSEPADEALALALAELASSPEGEVQVALRLEGNVGEVKALSTLITFDPAELEFVSARLSDGMASPIAETFFWSGTQEGKVQVDLAVLGTGVTIGGSGEVAVLSFRALGTEYALGFEEALLRGVENEELTADLEGLESRPEMPTAFRLAQNVPNPFNPRTTVVYEVPQASEVTIRVYDVTGRLVTTLVDGTIEPGRYSVEWGGTGGSGESVGSGVYFCVMETPEYHATHKMMLLK